MATKTELLNESNVGDAILAAAKTEHVKADRFEIVVYAPDDRRVDKLVEEDKGLRKELVAACSAPYGAYVAAMAAFLSAEEKAWNKQKAEERKPFEQKFVARLVQAHKDAAKAFETAVERDTQKVWKKAASGKSDLKGVQFEALVVPFLASFGFIAAAKTEAEQEQADLGKNLGTDLMELQIALDSVSKYSLRRAAADLPKVAGDQDKLNTLLKKMKADYEAGPRESQKDNPETSGDEEPDEAALNSAIFAEHGASIKAASHQIMNIYIATSNGADDCGGASKELVALMRKAGKLASVVEGDRAKAISKKVDAWGDVLKKIVALQSALKTDMRPIKNTLAIFEALEAGKAGALGLLDRAILSLADRSAAIKDIVKSLEDNPIGSRIS